MTGLIGIDEVGRGAWAGPLLVVAAQVKTELPEGLADSKALSKKRRQQMFDELRQSCNFGEGWVEPHDIDELGLTEAMRLAVNRALTAIKANPKVKIIMDGKINYCPETYSNVECVVKADSLYPVVSAASIYAKVLRDARMAELSLKYPNYGFEGHVGYGTKQHIDALLKFGVSKIHRLSYKPVKEVLNNDNNKHWPES